MYRITTGDIEVSVVPRFLPDESDAEAHRFVWAYTIAIINRGRDTVRLRSRHWTITDAAGHTEEVRGRGVVGMEPTLAPGERFEYTSGCPLRTPSGFMAGTYEMEDAAGHPFQVMIPAFSLDLPDVRRSVH